MVSCQSAKDEPKNQYYVEKKLSFFNPYEITFANGKYQGHTYQNWIRQPQNLKMLHETFKKIGYKKLFLRYDYSDWCGFLHDVRKPCDELIDSLILTYNSDTIKSKYYREFWNRRKIEGNDTIEHEVLKEVSAIVYQDSLITYQDNFVNDTLVQLIEIREFEDSLTNGKARSNFNYLKDIGLHNSAYNLLYERYRYYDIKWNQEELEKTLKKDTANCCPQAFIEDNTK